MRPEPRNRVQASLPGCGWAMVIIAIVCGVAAVILFITLLVANPHI